MNIIRASMLKILCMRKFLITSHHSAGLLAKQLGIIWISAATLVGNATYPQGLSLAD